MSEQELEAAAYGAAITAWAKLPYEEQRKHDVHVWLRSYVDGYKDAVRSGTSGGS